MKYPLLTLAILLGAPLAFAAPVTFTYQSTTDASAVGGPASEPVSVTFTFDSNSPNWEAQWWNEGGYGPWNGSLTVGGQTVKLTGGDILLWLDAGQSDGFDFRWDGGGPPDSGVTSSGKLFGQQLSFFRILIVDPTQTMFSSNALPTNPGFAPKTNYFIQDEYDLANGTSFGLDESNPPGRPYTLTLGKGSTTFVGTQFWDGKGAANDKTITGGTGTWNATAANWTDAGGTANSKWLGGSAEFGGTAGTVTLGGPISTLGLTFDVDGYVIRGSSTLNLTGSTLTMNGSATIAAPIAGKNGLIVDGPGKLILASPANSYSGGTTVAGALQIGTESASGSIGAGDITLDGGATLTVVKTKGNRITNKITTDGGVGTLVMDSADTITLAGPLLEGDFYQAGGGQLALTQSGTGTTIVANGGNDLFNGPITVTRGTLQFGTASSAGSAGFNFLNPRSGPQIVVSGTGTFKLVNVGLDTSFYEPVLGAFNKETTVRPQYFVNNIAVGAGGTVLLAPASSMQIDGVISGAGGVTVAGATPFDGLLLPGIASSSVTAILTGYNTYTGPTTVTSGILQIGDGNSGNLAPASAVTVKPMGTLVLDLQEGVNFGNNVTNSGRMALIGSHNYLLSGVIGGTGSLDKIGSGITTLTAASTYSGGTTINGGTLLAGNTTGSATGTGPVTVNSGGTLGGSGTVSGKVTLKSGGAIYPGAGTGSTVKLGVQLHLDSLTWEGGGSLEFGVGESTADQINLSGSLSKAGSGPWNIDINYYPSLFDSITPQTYTLLTFSSTNMKLSDFHLELPVNLAGTLVETSTSLLLEDLHPVYPSYYGGGAEDGGDGGLGDYGGAGDGGFTISGFGYDGAVGGLTGDVSMVTVGLGGPFLVSGVVPAPAPEPGSAALLVAGGSVFFGWRRRGRVRLGPAAIVTRL